MPIATIAVDLAKTVFEVAATDSNGKIVERPRLGRAQFERYFENRESAHIVMEACGTAHYWGRRFQAPGCGCRCCRPITCALTYDVTRTTALMPQRCWRRLAPAISFPYR